MFCDADFEGGICCNPGSNPAALRIQGITTPGDRNFAFYDPALQALKLPALRAVVAEQGAFTTPALSACFFFRPRLALLFGPTAAQFRLKSPWWGRDSDRPGRGAHSARAGQTRGVWDGGLSLPSACAAGCRTLRGRASERFIFRFMRSVHPGRG